MPPYGMPPGPGYHPLMAGTPGLMNGAPCLPNGMPLPPHHHPGQLPPGALPPPGTLPPRPMVAPQTQAGIVQNGGFNLHELMSQLNNLTPQQLQEIASMSQLVLHTQQGGPPAPAHAAPQQRPQQSDPSH